MKQAITGVVPSDVAEVEVRTIWPSICVYPSGRMLGRWFAIKWPDIYIFRLGNLLALLAIPHALLLYFYRVAPYRAIRYWLTNRRVCICRGLSAEVEKSIDLDGFDAIDIQVQDGQQWFYAADLVFMKDGTEVFRLDAVTRPDVARQSCLSVRQAILSVREVRAQQAAGAKTHTAT